MIDLQKTKKRHEINYVYFTVHNTTNSVEHSIFFYIIVWVGILFYLTAFSNWSYIQVVFISVKTLELPKLLGCYHNLLGYAKSFDHFA